MRDVKNPITISPFYTPASGSLVPVYQDIFLENVRSISPGAIQLIGIDTQHPLGVSLDGVTVEHLQSKDLRIAHARFSIGPGPVSFSLQGDDVTITKDTAAKEPGGDTSCKAAFVTFPTTSIVRPVEKSMNDEEPGAYIPRSGAKQQVTVAGDGSGDYKTVQEGIDALSENGGTVLLKPGVYREVVHIAKPHVRMQGLSEDPEKVLIVYSNSAYSSGGTFHSATVFVTGDDFSAENITFQNDYSRSHGLQPQGSQAIALSVRG